MEADKKRILLKESQQKKERIVKKLAERIANARTFMITSIKGLPSPQFQNIKKQLREHAKIKVAKKNILKRAIEELKKDSILPLENQVQENCAFVISDLEGFELARLLSKNKNPVFAKAGQIANEDIEIKAGPTSLAPGPAISELGSLGIQIAVEEGKISIKQPKIVVRKGEKINANVASLLQKLDIRPFNIGLEPVAVYDVETEKIYSDININPEKTAAELKISAGKALGFAQKIVYYCRETIGYFLAKADAGAKKLGSRAPKESPQESSDAEGSSSSEVNVKDNEKTSGDNAQLNKPEENA